MNRMKVIAAVLLAASLGACAQMPMGPRVSVMPPQGKPFEVFQQDQAICKQYASNETAGQSDSANLRALGTTVVGAGLGAGLGAAFGGGHGAAMGAAAGGGLGAVGGALGSNQTQKGIQLQYDNAYAQCMTAKGNQVAQPAPQPVYIQQVPQPVYVQPQPVYVQPQPMYQPQPQVIIVEPRRRPYGW